MSRRTKPVKTLHPLAVAQSIEAQNTAASQFAMAVTTMLNVAGDAIPGAVREMMQAELDQFRAAMWPDEES